MRTLRAEPERFDEIYGQALESTSRRKDGVWLNLLEFPEDPLFGGDGEIGWIIRCEPSALGRGTPPPVTVVDLGKDRPLQGHFLAKISPRPAIWTQEATVWELGGWTAHAATASESVVPAGLLSQHAEQSCRNGRHPELPGLLRGPPSTSPEWNSPGVPPTTPLPVGGG